MTVKPSTVILHSRADDVVPFADSEELVRNSGLPISALIEVGTDHRLADPEPLERMLKACEEALINAATGKGARMIPRHEAVHTIACYRFQIPFTNVRVRVRESAHDVALDTDAINLARSGLSSDSQQNALVDSLCAMTRIAWLVESTCSHAGAASEWDNAGTDIFRSLEFIRMLVVESIGFPAIAKDPELLDKLYGKFLQAGHRLAVELMNHDAFPVALDTLANVLVERGQITDTEATQVIEGNTGKSLLISDSLPDRAFDNPTEKRAFRYKSAIEVLANR